MRITLPILFALALLLAAFTIVRAEAASVADLVPHSKVSMAAIVSQANSTSTMTTTQVVTSVVISGVVVHGVGTALPEEFPVTLYTYRPGGSAMELVMTETVMAQPGGAFTFENVAQANDSVFMASVLYDGIPYHSTPGFGEPVTITVYDVTTATSHILSDQLHLILDFSQPETLQAMEVYILSNVGNQTILLGEGNQLMADFPLPEGALTPEYRSGTVDEIGLPTNDGYAEIPAVRPGEQYGVSFIFSLPYSQKITFSQPIGVPVNAIGVLLPALGTLKVESEDLISGGLSNFGEVAYQVYTGSNFPAGTELVLKVSGDPNATASEAEKKAFGSRLGLFIGLGAFGLVLILAGIWIGRRNRTTTEMIEDETVEGEEPVTGEAEAAVAEDADAVMDDIIALDDLYQAGKLPEAAYQKRRAELKEKLRVLTEENGL